MLISHNDLVEEGLVIREGGRYALADPNDAEAGIPEGLRDVIGKRLSRLSEKANQVLSIASVMGRDFRLDVLQTVSAQPEEDLFAALQEAEERAVIEERPAVGGVPAFRFTHAFFRQTLYEEIFSARRIRWHQQVARALETVHARRLEEHAAELAKHFAYSSDPSDLAKAVEYGQLAAQRAMSVYAYGEAVRHLENALKAQDVLDPDEKPHRCDLLLAFGEALIIDGEPRRAAEEIGPTALRLAQELHDDRRASLACQLALEGLRRFGGWVVRATPDYRDWANLADRYAQDGTAERMRADLALAELANFPDRDNVRALSLRQQALQLARRLDAPQLSFEACLLLVEASLNTPEHSEDRLHLAEEVVSWPRENVRSQDLVEALDACADVFLGWGDLEEAENVWRQTKALGQRTRAPFLLLLPVRRDAIMATLYGELEEVLRLASQLVASADELGAPVWARRQAGILSGRPLLWLGRFADIGSGVEEARQLAAVGDEVPFVSDMRVLALFHTGHQVEARELLASYVESLPSAPPGRLRTGQLAIYLELALLLEDASAAGPLANRLQPAAKVLDVAEGGLRCAVARLLGGASALLGEPEHARAYYQGALGLCARVGFRPEIALTRLQLAELLLEHFPAERTEARDHLDFAIEEFRAMKMAPSRERALELRRAQAGPELS